MRRRLTALVFLVLAALLGANLAASAASPNDTTCRKATVSGSASNDEILAYNACRFDMLDAQVAALKGTTPTPAPTPTPKPTASPTATSSPTSTPPTATSSPTSAPPTSTPPPPAAAACQPGKEVVKFTGEGSAGLGQYGQGNYDASAELWGVNGYNYKQTMGVCTHDAWYVDVTTDNSKGDGAVKAYPSMRRIYHDWSTSDFSKDPLVSSFPQLKVTFGSNDPTTCPGCIYDTAFDIWLNGIGNGNANELMIWTHNVGQYPYGSKVGSGINIAGHTWDLYSGNSNHYLAFVPTDTSNIPSGTFDIQDFTDYLSDHSRISASSRMGQISYGVETVSTGGVSRHWDFTKLTVVDS